MGFHQGGLGDIEGDEEDSGSGPIGDDQQDSDNEILLEDIAEEVLEDQEHEDNAQNVFDFHQGPVYSCDLHPNHLSLAAAGSGDDTMSVWDLKEGHIVYRCTDFKDSVVHVRFNKDGAYLAAVDMAGAIKVWRVSSNIGIEGGGSSGDSNCAAGAPSCDRSSFSFNQVFQFDASEATWMEWHSGTNVLFLGTRESELWMWKIPSGEGKVFMGGGDKVECARMTPDGRKMWVGYADGSMKLFDLRSEGQCLHNLVDDLTSHSPHTVTSIATHNSLMASGCASGVAKVFNMTSGKNVGIFVGPRADARSRRPRRPSNNCEEPEDEQHSQAPMMQEGHVEDEVDEDSDDSHSIESVLFSPDHSFLVTGSLGGMITAWDLSTQVARGSVDLHSGVVKMEWRNPVEAEKKDRHGHILIVATLGGGLDVVDMRSFEVLAEGVGHTSTILDFAQSRDGQHVLTASEDTQMRLYDIESLMTCK